MEFSKSTYYPGMYIILITLLGMALLLAPGAQAQDFVYTPRNPAFGGNPLNYSNFLNGANAQNKFQRVSSFGQRNTLEDFQESLQRQILSQLTRQIVTEQFGSDLNLQQENNFEFGEFNISINPRGDGVSILIRNNFTGESTNITIPTNF